MLTGLVRIGCWTSSRYVSTGGQNGTQYDTSLNGTVHPKIKIAMYSSLCGFKPVRNAVICFSLKNHHADLFFFIFIKQQFILNASQNKLLNITSDQKKQLLRKNENNKVEMILASVNNDFFG